MKQARQLTRQVAIDDYNMLKKKGLIVYMPHGVIVPQQCYKIEYSPRFQLALKCIEEAQTMQLQGGEVLKEIGERLVKLARKKIEHQVDDYTERCEEYMKRIQTKEKCCHMCGHKYDDDEWEEEDDNLVVACSEACRSQIPDNDWNVKEHH